MNQEKRKQKRRRAPWARLLTAVALCAAVCLGALWLGLYSASYGTGFTNSLYEADALSGQRALFLVPHEDDELMMAGAAIRLYQNAGAEVYVAFATNGDDGSDPAVRVDEALKGLAALGVPEDQTLFLGYGDRWNTDAYAHIYHAPAGETVPSAAGKTETYGTAAHPDYHSAVFGQPAAYTRDNYRADIKSMVDTLRPDAVFCIDLDTHPDHCALSLLFEEAMSELLREAPGYRPTVYKGYAYATAWFAPADYYGENMGGTALSTDPMTYNDKRYAPDTPAFAWEDRVRFPVPAETLGYTLRAGLLYRALSAHASQYARFRGACAINGDQVFWLRRTDSLLYEPGVNVAVSSGESSYLTDFKLADTSLIHYWPMPFDRCVWRPEGTDETKQVTVTFPGPRDVATVSLYDNCDPENNITAGTLTFSDGSRVEVGPLREKGAETVVAFPVKSGITGFTFTIDAYTGDVPGLNELCAYGPEQREEAPRFLKLTAGEQEDFCYRLTVHPGESLRLGTYRYPEGSAADTVTVTAGDGTVGYEDGMLTVAAEAKPGKHRVRAFLTEDPAVYDEIEVVVPSRGELAARRVLAWFEKLLDRVEYRAEKLLRG